MKKSSLKNTRVIFFGTAGFAVPVLEALVKEGYEVMAVITQPDKPTGRKQVLTPPPIKLAAQRLRLKVYQPPKLEIGNLKLEIPNVDIDIGVVAAYGKLIPPEIFNLPKHGTVVVHPSLLPKHRGPSPVQTAIMNGDATSGVTIMKIDEELDHGDIISRSTYTMPTDKYFEEINDNLWQLGAKLLIETLPEYLFGKTKPQPQDHSRATFTKKFTSADGEIKPNETAEQAYNKIKALNPEPGTFVWFEKRNKKLHLKILKAQLQNGILKPEKVQLEGGKSMSFEEFKMGHPNFKTDLIQ